MKTLPTLLLLLIVTDALAKAPVGYRLDHRPGNDFISVTISLPGDVAAATDTLVIPRSAPGTYSLEDYAAFVEAVQAITAGGQRVNGERGMGSYFTFAVDSGPLSEISYRVNLTRMESALKDGSATSKLRGDYLGLLGYSVFGYAEGLVDRPVNLVVNSAPDWPVFSTLAPRAEPPAGQAEFTANSFAELADAQYLLGKDLRIHSVDEAPIPLFVALYSEVPADLNEIGRRALISLNGLADYFGHVPMPHYTVVLEYIIPPTPEHRYGFWMEHLNSMTGTSDAAHAVTGFEENPRLGGIVHHMGHAWVPLRSYGEGYRPFEWQIAPLVDTIWLNEGFTWYVAYYNVLDNEEILEFWRDTLGSAPSYIRQLSLRDLSRLGSTQYAMDFRIGRNLFSRGALLAHDLDREIQSRSGGERSFRDVMLGLLAWTREHQRPFTYEEIEPIMSASAGIDLSATWNRWQAPPQ